MHSYTDGTFLCVPCAGGYYSYYGEFYNPDRAKRVYIIRGANGVCTHMILAAVHREATKRHIQTEKIYSQRDPGMLEALALPDSGIYLLDGNYPRNITEKYPVAVETVINADAFADAGYMQRNASAVKMIAGLQEKEQRRSLNYFSAVRSVYNDTIGMLSSCTDREKIRRYASRFAAREFPVRGNGHSKAKNRFLSAVTPYGVLTNYETVEKYDRIIAIDDPHGYAASVLILALKKEAEERGLACTVCRCQLRPEDKAEHILIPEANLVFFTANAYHPAPQTTERIIHINRFVHKEKAADCRFRLKFNQKAEKELLTEAVKAEAAAKELHDIMNSYYETAIQEDRLQSYTEELLEEIFSA